MEGIQSDILYPIGDAATRVMSPYSPVMFGLPAMSPNTTQSTQLMTTQANNGLLLGIYSAKCMVCNMGVSEPTVCAGCGVWGHPVCVGSNFFENYTFCNDCAQRYAEEYAMIDDAQQRNKWRSSLSTQLVTWKQRATTIIGRSASIGLTIGGAAATATQAIAAVAHGMVQGATAAAAADQPIMDTVPAVPAIADQRLLHRQLQKSSSTGDLIPLNSPPCPRCALGKNTKGSWTKHTYTGACKGFPSSVWFGKKKPALAMPPKELDLLTGSPRLPDAANMVEAEIAQMLDADKVLKQVPPSSFGSANSEQGTSFYGKTKTERAVAAEPNPTMAGSSSDVTMDGVMNELRAQSATNEKLTRAIQELQDSASRLETRVSEIEYQWQHEEQVGPSTHYYDVSTPREDPNSEWYGVQQDEIPLEDQVVVKGAEEQQYVVPPRVNNLATAANSFQDVFSGQAGFQGQDLRAADELPSIFIARNQGAYPHIPEIQGLRREPVPSAVPMTDSEVFSFLGRSTAPVLPQPGMTSNFGAAADMNNIIQQQGTYCATPTMTRLPEVVSRPPGSGGGDSSPPAPSQADLSMLLKAIDTFIKAIPKLELGDIGTRANRLLTWKVSVGQMIIPVSLVGMVFETGARRI